MARHKRTIWKHPRTQDWWENIVPDFDNETFIRNFRVSHASFNYICRRLGPVMERQNNNYQQTIPVGKRIAIALWRLATNNVYRSVAHLFGVGTSTVCCCVGEFCDAVIEVLLPDHIKTPDTRRLREMSTYFANKWGAPQCVGAIDGSHIPILTPCMYARDYHNRKGWSSIILQAVVDGKGLIWDVCVGFPGSVHDARVLRQSWLWESVNDGEFFSQNIANISGHNIGQYLIGDPAYPLQTWLMKPFSDTGRLTPEQVTYNSRISRARCVVETTFGKLKGRWRCLLKRNDCHVERTKKMVLVCCVLHNICEENYDDYLLTAITDHNQPLVRPFRDVGPQEGQHQNPADVRTALVEYFNRF